MSFKLANIKEGSLIKALKAVSTSIDVRIEVNQILLVLCAPYLRPEAGINWRYRYRIKVLYKEQITVLCIKDDDEALEQIR